MYRQENDKGHQNSDQNNVTLDLIKYWINCNVYTNACINVKKNIYLAKYNKLHKCTKKEFYRISSDRVQEIMKFEKRTKKKDKKEEY